ncbi:glycoside hydrolase family 3 protein [Neobacillus notoginsengisoli]
MKINRFMIVAMVLSLVLLSVPFSAQANWQDPVKPGWKVGEVKKGWIQSKIQHMTLEEKVGQLFIVHVYGKNAEDPAYEATNLNNNRGGKNFREVIEKYKVGGVIYFNWTDNITTPADAAQVNKLSNDIQKIAMEQRMAIPLYISTDQEGGIVQRLTTPGTVFPGSMALGATRSTDLAAKSGDVLAKELKAIGVNMDFAPVADVNVNPANPVIGVRSFGEDPKLVSDMTVAQVKAFQDEDVIATAKHFPGHGDTAVDSHYGLPIINHDLETLHKVDLAPFKAAIGAGVDAIMTAHIVVPALDDSGLPATLSKPILTDLLRGEMGFDGLIITDSLGMSGANVIPADRVPVEAFKAGSDILLNPPNVEVAYNGVLNAVKSGEISEKRLDESVYRILEYKMKRGLFHNPNTDPSAVSVIGAPEHLAVADEIADKSITLVKNEGNLLPLQKTEKVFVTGPSSGKPALLASQMAAKGFSATSYAASATPTAGQISTAVTQAANADKVIVTTYNGATNNGQVNLIKALQASGKKVIVAAIRNPYDLMGFPTVDAYLTTYGDRDVSIHSLAKVLAGEVNPTGKLPVTIPGLYGYGTGLTY